MEEKEFITKNIIDINVYKEFVYTHKKIADVIFTISYIIVGIFFIFLKKYEIESVILGIMIGAAIVDIANEMFTQRMYNKVTNRNSNFCNIIAINKDGIQIQNPDSNNKLEVTFEQIKSITETSNMFILRLYDKRALSINKNNLSGGSKEEFIQFILNKCVNIKNKKIYHLKKQSRFWKKYLIFILILIIILITKPIIQKNRIIGYLEANGYGIKEVTTQSSSIDYLIRIEKEDKFERVLIYKLKNKNQAKEFFISLNNWTDEENGNESIEQGRIYEDMRLISLLDGKYILYAEENEQKEEVVNLFMQLKQYL